MKTKSLYLSLIAAALAGCATPFRAPAGLEHVRLERGHSPVVLVEKVWLERTDGALFVRGYVIRRPDATDTSDSHLDVTLYDASDRVLRHRVEPFAPGDIPRRLRRHYDAIYRVPLDPLPPDTVRIEVRAHESRHP